MTEKQKKFVAPNVYSIVEAHYSDHAWFRAIYADDTPVGFIMVSIDKEKSEYFLWRLMVDADHQRKGYARQAVLQLIEHIKQIPNAEELVVSYVPGEGSPQPFYIKLGFEETGELEGNEKIMNIKL